jgi:hypothetical protein
MTCTNDEIKRSWDTITQVEVYVFIVPVIQNNRVKKRSHDLPRGDHMKSNPVTRKGPNIDGVLHSTVGRLVVHMHLGVVCLSAITLNTDTRFVQIDEYSYTPLLSRW